MSLTSVVIPTRETRDLLVQCLGSLEGWPREGLEVIVVLDGGTRAFEEEIQERFPWVGILSSPEPRGFTRAANQGLRAARGDLLLLLNSDTEVSAEGFPALLQEFRRRSRLGIGGATLTFPDGRPQWAGGREPGLLWLFALASGAALALARVPGYRRLRPSTGTVGTVDWVTGAAMALRREVWEEIGPLDEGFRFYCQDLDFCLRAKAAGWEVAVVPGFRVIHHHGATIGKDQGATSLRQHPEYLWTDLLRWAEKHRGERWARRAARVLALGASLRLLGLRVRRHLSPPSRRREIQQDLDAYRVALQAVREWRRGIGA